MDVWSQCPHFFYLLFIYIYLGLADVYGPVTTNLVVWLNAICHLMSRSSRKLLRGLPTGHFQTLEPSENLPREVSIESLTYQ